MGDSSTMKLPKAMLRSDNGNLVSERVIELNEKMELLLLLTVSDGFWREGGIETLESMPARDLSCF